MILNIADITEPDHDEWMNIWLNCPWATFFESPEWSYCWENAYGNAYRAAPLLFVFNDGSKAIIPGTRGKRLLPGIQIRESSPGGTYGGPISTHNLTEKHFLLLVEKLGKVSPNISFRSNPYFFNKFSVPQTMDHDFTQAVRLPKEKDELVLQLKKKRVIRHAERARMNGFYIKMEDESAVEKLYEIYHNAQQRWRQTAIVYTTSFFRELISSKYVDLWGCYDKSRQLVGGGIVVMSQGHVVSWFRVMRTDVLKYHVSELYHTELFWHYRSLGYSWFDLNPSGGNKGVEQFKDKYNPEKLMSPVLNQRSMLVKSMDFIRKSGRQDG